MKNLRLFLPSFLLTTVVLLPLLVLTCLQLGRLVLQSTSVLRLKTEKMQTIVLPLQPLMWEKEGKELQVNKRLFDVVHYSTNEQYITLTGYFDDAETNLLAQITTQSSLANNGALQLLLVLQVFFSCGVFFLLLYRHCAGQSWWFLFTPLLPQPFFGVAGPPPRCCF